MEPSAAMRAQRRADLPQAIDAVAEALPCADDTFDASMAIVTVHQWADLARGIAELRRVTRDNVVIMTFDDDAFGRFWLGDCMPELMATERRRFPAVGTLQRLLGGNTEISRFRSPETAPTASTRRTTRGQSVRLIVGHR